MIPEQLGSEHSQMNGMGVSMPYEPAAALMRSFASRKVALFVAIRSSCTPSTSFSLRQDARVLGFAHAEPGETSAGQSTSAGPRR
jgi:hypothetical protein